MRISDWSSDVCSSYLTDAGFRAPLPDQAAAMIGLLDDVTAAQRPDLMRALNGTGLQVSILGTAPPLQDNEIARPALEQLVRHYLAADGATGNRFLSVRVGSGNFRLLRRFPRLRHILENHEIGRAHV